MSCFMISLDILAISGDSLVFSPILMAIMLHPLFTTPIAKLTENLSKLWRSSIFPNHKVQNIYVNRLFTFSIDVYFAFIIVVQYYLFQSWLDFAKTHAVKFIGFTRLDFNLCLSEEEAMNGNENFQDFLTLIPSTLKSYGLLAMAGMMLLYHGLKTCLVNQFSIVPLYMFTFGPEVVPEDDEPTTPVDLDEVELSSIGEEVNDNQEAQTTLPSMFGASDVFCNMVAQTYIFGILALPLLFDYFVIEGVHDSGTK